MLPNVGSAARSAMNPAALGATMSQFLACRQPWNEYIDHVTRQDAEPFPAKLNPAPMYRGRHRGREGWLFKEAVQLHYRRYPDEHIFTNLQRWRQGDLVDDIALQQFRGAQPHLLDDPDPQGFKNPPPEAYMKLNYKNAMMLSKYVSRTGHFYPEHVLRISPEAFALLRGGLHRARLLGLYPKTGNPFWHRLQSERPRVYDGEYNPLKARVRGSMEQFSYNWLQTYRIKRYFSQRKGEAARRSSTEHQQQELYYQSRTEMPTSEYAQDDVPYSPKVSTVPGTISTKGLRKNPHLYSKMSKRRMGFPNPLGTTKRL